MIPGAAERLRWGWAPLSGVPKGGQSAEDRPADRWLEDLERRTSVDRRADTHYRSRRQRMHRSEEGCIVAGHLEGFPKGGSPTSTPRLPNAQLRSTPELRWIPLSSTFRRRLAVFTAWRSSEQRLTERRRRCMDVCADPVRGVCPHSRSPPCSAQQSSTPPTRDRVRGHVPARR